MKDIHQYRDNTSVAIHALVTWFRKELAPHRCEWREIVSRCMVCIPEDSKFIGRG